MLELILITSAMCIGVNIAAKFNGWEAFDEDPAMMRKAPIENKMALWWLRYYGSYLPRVLRKPLYACPPCMASLWSVPMFIYSGLPIYLLPVFMLAVAGINAIIAYNYEL